MLIVDLQQKILGLQSQLNVCNSPEKFDLYDRLTKFYNMLNKESQDTPAKQWQIIATATWEDTIDKLI